jgi:hypothetical protein
MNCTSGKICSFLYGFRYHAGYRLRVDDTLFGGTNQLRNPWAKSIWLTKSSTSQENRINQAVEKLEPMEDLEDRDVDALLDCKGDEGASVSS